MSRKRSATMDEDLAGPDTEFCASDDAPLDMAAASQMGLLDSMDQPDSFLGVSMLEAREEPEAPGVREKTKPTVAADTSGRKRKAVVPPEKLKKGMTLFEYLSNCQPPLDKKIADIAVAQTGVPTELKDDAVQEIYITWSSMKPDTKQFKPGQIASYAHRVAGHTALRLRRELGSSVRLPGSAFRKKKDGSTYVTPGLLSVPLQWEELEGWLDADDAADSAYTVQGSNNELAQVLEGLDVNSATAEDEETEKMNARLAFVDAKASKLSSQQREILILLIRGHSYESIQNTLKLKRAMLLNEIEEATAALYKN